MEVVFHRLVQRDVRTALLYYDAVGGSKLGDRFFAELEACISQVGANPKRFHFIADGLRRVSLESFPYHLIYEERVGGVRFLVLRHDNRHPRFGLGRR